eukprot:CAMPEP_0194421942 /NCGR_PEP_ID=MMETSP0176-20130528/21216_1 /TAXON_ID=216777 /ORGANISM="Proboscia alata, Strain PI-D3" /LENGTH=331 /DNA_ID=CAMNT_0039230369 /DNA_START=170 /DNA_END=1165 /DNA_ORIENTATION=-
MVDSPRNGRDLLTAIAGLSPTGEDCTDSFIDAHAKAKADAHGKVVKGDFITIDRSIALDRLYCYINQDKLRLESGGPRSREKARKWDFRRSLHRHFDRTLDDVMRAFLLWATITTEKDRVDLINVTRAFRRIEMYANWLEYEGSALDELPPDSSHMRQMSIKYKRHMQFNYDESGRFLFWLDFSPDALSDIFRELSQLQRFQLFLWTIHLIMFDSNAQVNGVFVTRYADFHSFSTLFTYLSHEMLPSMQKLLFSASSIKHIYYLNVKTPIYERIFFRTLEKFMHKSTRQTQEYRKDNGIEVLHKFSISQCIPDDFGDYNVANDHSRKRRLG